MKKNPDTRLGAIENVATVFSFFIKFSSLTGFLVFVFYLVTNSSFPMSLNLGDGFLFVVIGLSFGVLYLMLFGALFSLGYFCILYLSPFVIFVLPKTYEVYPNSRCLRLKIQFRRLKKRFMPDGLVITTTAGLGGGFLVLFANQILQRTDVLITENIFEVFALILVCFLGAFGFIALLRYEKQIKEVKKIKDKSDVEVDKLNRLYKDQIVFLLLCLVAPLPLSKLTTTSLINRTMVVLNIRHEHVSVIIKEPYTTLLQDNNIMAASGWGKEQKIYSGATIIRMGIGDTIAVKFIGKPDRVFEIPRSHFVLWDSVSQ